MHIAILALLLGLLAFPVAAQDRGLVGGVANFQVRVNYYRPRTRTVDSDIPRPMFVQAPMVTQSVPTPYHVRLFEFEPISEAEAVSLGLSPSTIQMMRSVSGSAV